MSVIPVASLQCVAQMFAMWLSASMGLYFAISSYSTVGNKWKLQLPGVEKLSPRENQFVSHGFIKQEI